MPAKREMSVEAFRALKHKPKQKQPRGKHPGKRLYADLGEQYARSKTPVCPPDCAEGSRLYHEMVVATLRLRDHRESHA